MMSSKMATLGLLKVKYFEIAMASQFLYMTSLTKLYCRCDDMTKIWEYDQNSDLEILHQCGERVKTKRQKVFGANSYVCRSCRGKTCREIF